MTSNLSYRFSGFLNIRAIDSKRFSPAAFWSRASRFFVIGSLVIGSLTSEITMADTSSVCALDHCGLFADGAYTNLVIGRLTHIGTDDEMRQVFQWAKSHGYWKSLPDSIDPYLRDLKLATITLPPGQGDETITVLMQKEEYNSAPYAVGDLVRYSPHDLVHEAPHGNADDFSLYHGLTGCIATLCRQGDATCVKPYQEGVFTATQGKPINLKTGAVEPVGTRINPTSLLPIN